MTFADIERIALALPDTERGTSYGTAAVKVRGKLLARLKEDGATMVLCAVLPDERALLMEMAPRIFHVTDHYRAYPTMLVHLGTAEPDQMAALLAQSWRRLAPKKTVERHDATGAGPGRGLGRRLGRGLGRRLGRRLGPCAGASLYLKRGAVSFGEPVDFESV